MLQKYLIIIGFIVLLTIIMVQINVSKENQEMIEFCKANNGYSEIYGFGQNFCYIGDKDSVKEYLIRDSETGEYFLIIRNVR